MIATINGLPVYEAIIGGEDFGMVCISLVDDPAVMSNFQAFANAPARVLCSIQDEERRLVRGVVMRADFPIYRYDAQRGEYYIIYTAEQIRRMAEKYLADSLQNEVNLMHQYETRGVQMVQYFIKDTGAGISPAGFEDITDGSLFAEFHILNDEVWASIKAGEFRGFSLEGYFDLQPSQRQEELDTISDNLKGRFSKMSRLTKIKTALAKILAEFGTITTNRGILSWDGDGELEVGVEVFIEDEEGNRTKPEDGDYSADNGVVYAIADGKVVDVKEPGAEVTEEEPEEEEPVPVDEEPEVPVEPMEEEEPVDEPEPVEEEPEEPEELPGASAKATETDKGVLYLAGEIAVGVPVFKDEAMTEPAPDGEYKTESEVIVVVEGVVASVVSAEVAELRRQVAELTAEVEALRRQPVAEPAHEVVKTAEEAKKTGNRGLDALSRILASK